MISFSNRNWRKNAWNRHWRSFIVDTGILSNNTKFLSHEFEMTFCSLIKYNDNPPLLRIYANPWLFFYRTRPFTDLWEVSIEHLRQVTLLFRTPDPIWDFHMFFLSIPILFPNVTLFFPDYSLRMSLELVTFSILLAWKRKLAEQWKFAKIEKRTKDTYTWSKVEKDVFEVTKLELLQMLYLGLARAI